jgi:anaerobic dimethyl sulfoxide reductase subunit B
MGRLGFYFDSRRCMGCRTCQVACKERNDLRVDENFRRVRTFETGGYPNARMFHYSGACNHCAEAKCVTVCPTGAMHYADDGTVQHNKVDCIACGECVSNCPYGAVQFIEESGTAGKCDSCRDLRDAGENPVCVDACLMRCLKFGDMDDLVSEFGPELVNELPVLPSANITKPSLLIKAKDCALLRDFKELAV